MVGLTGRGTIGGIHGLRNAACSGSEYHSGGENSPFAGRKASQGVSIAARRHQVLLSVTSSPAKRSPSRSTNSVSRPCRQRMITRWRPSRIPAIADSRLRTRSSTASPASRITVPSRRWEETVAPAGAVAPGRFMPCAAPMAVLIDRPSPGPSQSATCGCTERAGGLPCYASRAIGEIENRPDHMVYGHRACLAQGLQVRPCSRGKARGVFAVARIDQTVLPLPQRGELAGLGRCPKRARARAAKIAIVLDIGDAAAVVRAQLEFHVAAEP